jgi:hypothetical protein
VQFGHDAKCYVPPKPDAQPDVRVRPIADVGASADAWHRESKVGFIIDCIVDWFWVGFMLRLKEKHPGWFWTIIALQLALLVALFALIFDATR